MQDSTRSTTSRHRKTDALTSDRSSRYRGDFILSIGAANARKKQYEDIGGGDREPSHDSGERGFIHFYTVRTRQARSKN